MRSRAPPAVLGSLLLRAGGQNHRTEWAVPAGDMQMPDVMSPAELKAAIPRGLLAFPLTDFNPGDAFDGKAYAKRLQWLLPYKATGLFVAGGTGEFFSLTFDEYRELVRVAVQTCRGQVPVIAGTGYGTRLAIAYAQEAERLDADGLLLMPPYLVEGSQDGLRAHIAAICKSVRIGVIVYNRANCRITPETMTRLCEENANLIGFKDGVGDLERLAAIRKVLGDRVLIINGMPTAETFAPALRAAGAVTYSSAVFNFAPRMALDFHRAVHSDDVKTVERLTKDFFGPYVAIRNHQPGYAVSIVKAGAAIVGRSAGSVRPPLSNLTADEYNELKVLIARLGPQD
jgi:5-dehydro-4-deoxyglucarate dehydratase